MTLRTLFAKLLLLGAITAATVGAVALAPGQRSTYGDAVIDKQQRLESLPPGKLVLVGGSNVAFGVDTPRLSAALGRPGVNMGLFGEVPLAFDLEQVKPSIAPGDLIVLSPEYENLFERPKSWTTLCSVITTIPRPWRFASWPDCARCTIVTAVHRFQNNTEFFTRKLLRQRQREEPNNIYRHDALDAYGDMRRHLDRPSTFSLASIPRTPWLHKIDEKALKALAQFGKYARAKGATTVLVYPVLVADAFAVHRTAIGQLDRRLRRDIGPAISILGTPEDFVLPLEDFFDTEYHTNARGRVLHTEKLEKLLAPHRR